MSYFGNLDKKSIVLLLDNGIASLKDDVKEGEKDLETLWFNYRKLHEVLYREGEQLLSMTNKVRFEKRLSTIKKMLEKN